MGFTLYNTAGTSTTYIPKLKISGPYSSLPSASLNTITATSGINFSGAILQAGDSFSFDFSQAGMNVAATVYLFPNTSPLKSVYKTGIASGDNTV